MGFFLGGGGVLCASVRRWARIPQGSLGNPDEPYSSQLPTPRVPIPLKDSVSRSPSSSLSHPFFGERIPPTKIDYRTITPA